MKNSAFKKGFKFGGAMVLLFSFTHAYAIEDLSNVNCKVKYASKCMDCTASLAVSCGESIEFVKGNVLDSYKPKSVSIHLGDEFSNFNVSIVPTLPIRDYYGNRWLEDQKSISAVRDAALKQGISAQQFASFLKSQSLKLNGFRSDINDIPLFKDEAATKPQTLRTCSKDGTQAELQGAAKTAAESQGCKMNEPGPFEFSNAPGCGKKTNVCLSWIGCERILGQSVPNTDGQATIAAGQPCSMNAKDYITNCELQPEESRGAINSRGVQHDKSGRDQNSFQH